MGLKIHVLVILSVFLSSICYAANSRKAQALQEEWMGIYSGEDKIGYSHTVIKETENLEISEETKLKLTVLGTNREVETKSDYVLNGYLVESFHFVMKAGEANVEAQGKRVGNELKIQTSSVSGKTYIDFPLTGKPLVSVALFKWLSEQTLEAGRKYVIPLFDPTLVLAGAKPENLKTTLVIEGEEVIELSTGSFKTHRVKMFFAGSESQVWITEEGEVIKEASSIGLVSIRETEEKALRETLSNLDIVEKTAVSSNVSLDDARNLKLLRVKVNGIESTDGFDLHDNNRQFVRDGVIEIRKDDISQVKSYTLPYSGEQYIHLVNSTSLIQSDNPMLINKSKEILQGEKNSLKAAKKINNWVYKNLKKVPTVSIPNALDVLKTGEGDCNEHAALFAALSRASGIPTNIALGIVYVDGKFYYHAWNEVFIGKWVSVDPVFGQFPADASHIKFIEGDLARAPEIIRLVGKINLDIKEAS